MERHPALWKHRWLQKAFDRPWWQVFLLLALTGVVLHLTAPLIGIHDLPGYGLEACSPDGPGSLTCETPNLEEICTAGSLNNGFWYQENWLLVLPILLPLLLTILSWAAVRFFREIRRLQNDARIIRIRPGYAGAEFDDTLSNRIGALGRSTFWICVTVTLLITYLDTIDLTAGFYYYSQSERHQISRVADPPRYVFAEEDWSVATWAKSQWVNVCLDRGFASSYNPPNLIENLMFNVATYAVQALMIFFALFWVAKIWQALFCFSRALEGDEPIFELHLNVSESKLGLGALGAFYNSFLICIVGFETYILFHRLQQIELSGGPRWIDYLVDLFESPQSNLSVDRAFFSSMDGGQIMLIFGIALPVVVVCWLPLVKIRAYIQTRKNELSDELSRQLSDAQTEDDEELIEDYEKRLARLEKANIWPNGDKTAWTLMLLTASLWLCAVYPPLIPTVVASGLLAEIMLLLKGFFSPGNKETP